MKGIVLIFLILGFGVMCLFGQSVALEHQHNDVQRRQISSGYNTLLAQGSEAQDASVPKTEPNPSTQEANRVESAEHPEQTLEKAPNNLTQQTEVANSENGETIEETHTAWEKTQRIFKVVNNYELAPDAVVTTLVIIAGNAKLHGRVTGNVLVLGGDVELGSGAQVNGTLHLIGGQVTGNIERITHLQVSNRWQIVPAVVKLVMHPYSSIWATDKVTGLQFTIIRFALLLIMYLLIAAVFPKPVNAVSTLFAHRPIGSTLFSLLMLAVIPLILAFLTVSIVGVPFMLLALALLLPLALCGKTAIFLTLGSTLFSGRLRPLASIFGYMLYFMATSLPYIDWITFLVVNTVGIGICVLCGLSLMRQQGSRRNTSVLPGNEWGSRTKRV